MGPLEVLCCITAIIFAIYYYYVLHFDFWKSRGVRGPEPKPIYGTVKNVFLLKQNMGDYLLNICNEYKDEPMIGIFNRREPVLVIKDAELIKDVLIKNFSKFADRGIPPLNKAEPLSQHLFNLEPKRWRPLRTRLSPVFTSGKLKEMFSMISKCADHLEQYVDKLATKNDAVECRELMAKYTTDVIGSCAFGIEMNALSDEDSEFRKIGRDILTPSWTNILRFRVRRFTPKLFTILAYILPYTKSTKFFMRLLMENISYREKNNIIRHDFVDILRELKKNPDKIPDITLTDALLASQAFVFFVAGFETSSSTMSNALYELALNQKIQDKLREEIYQEYIEHDNDMTYENIKKMTYLNKVFEETLRKYPPVTFLMRQSVEAHTFDGTSVTIPKDIKVWIPVYAIHRDPNIYSEPNVFDPERFDEQASHNREPMFYLPFGDGPRNCIGARFAIFQTKIGLIKLLRNYKVETCKETRPYVNDPKAFLLAPKHGIHLKITKIHRS